MLTLLLLLTTTAPEAPKNVKYTAVKDTSVTISWEAPALNGKLVNYHITGGPTPDVTTTGLTYTFNNLEAGKYYLISVSAESSGGTGSATTIGPIFSATSKLK